MLLKRYIMQNFALGEVVFTAFPFIHEYFFPSLLNAYLDLVCGDGLYPGDMLAGRGIHNCQGKY